ncbi:DUF6443 domain-containing protein [Flavobacterium johnsoniae]|uniref:DUF6443 domain-containing protein n=6 Tax=Flavobacterium johnsoniae TaxID=986 RepID=A5FGI4_FLAJ1|nr:DUF6443 domain-containing protein [Flavobacterium johnsoniae]ABQ05691.1 hypothetical protein Fjoh_2668 [Flavobacterium johnsoniae UW101]WQG81428.1 DUF6443 domain-containing protein [Flavobacterium johnsoniae UW101]
MKKRIFILLFQITAFFSYSQDTIIKSVKSNLKIQAVVDPGGGDPTGYPWFRDADGDGYGNPDVSVIKNTKPSGYVSNKTDLDDGNKYITNIPPHTVYQDKDGDGFGNSSVISYASTSRPGYVDQDGDCNDNDASINPNNVWYRDADGDGYGWSSSSMKSCLQPSGYVKNASDYDDSTGNITNIAPQYFFRDADLDGYGNPSNYVYYSSMPNGYVANNLDCDDFEYWINPNTTWYLDADRDGYGDSRQVIVQCTQPAGYIRTAGDYDDSNRNITNIPPQIFYYDADKDGFGNPSISGYFSVHPNDWSFNNLDCNDNDPSINPLNVWYYDGDGDGFGWNALKIQSCTPVAGYVRNNSDYDDTNAEVTDRAPQYYYQDKDRDGYGDPYASVYRSYAPSNWVSNGNDCNDNDASINPKTRWYLDQDGDGYGELYTGGVLSCLQPAGYVNNVLDYDDSTVNITNIAPQYFYQDADGDGYGNKNKSVYYSVPPAGYVANSADYSDTDIYITNIAPHTVYKDGDGDGFGYALNMSAASVSRPGYVDNNTDCNDNDASINPNTIWYLDDDLDGLGDPANFVQQCGIPNGNYVLNNLDNCPLITGTYSDCSAVTTPSTDQNYIITKTYKQPLTAIVDFPAADQAQSSITYFDGLGRPIQQISNKQSSSGSDIITHIDYDDIGRQIQEYLPYKSQGTTMAYEESAKDNTITFYSNDAYENTTNPFSQKMLESSPLNRVLKQAAPGASWAMDSGHEIKLRYDTNTDGEVKLYKANTSWNADSGLYEISFQDSGSYVKNELYKNITYDENTGSSPVESSGSTVEFKNKEGQVVLKRTYNNGEKHDTHYVYDIYGNLTYVIPPKADGVINTDILNDLCYQYKYDYRNRLVEKKLPGKQWEFIVYDKLDKPVATGPAFSPFKDDSSIGWMITKYDAFGRPVYTGWSNQTCNSAARKAFQDTKNNETVSFETKEASGSVDDIQVYYSNAIEPKNIKLLTVNYYDNYAYPNAPAVPSAIEGDPVLSNVKGLATGNWTRTLTTASNKDGEISTTLYDLKARPVRTYMQNHLGGYTQTDVKLDFTGKTLYSISKHKRTSGAAELTVKEEFAYSPQDRLLTHTHQINGGAVELLASNTYDDLGQLISKKTGNSTGNPLQKVDYKYNIRGWLTAINQTGNLQADLGLTDLFAFKINYDKPSSSDITSLYNGNISETAWRTSSDFSLRSYRYEYDKLNRLTSAVYAKPEDAISVSGAYNESLMYDKNGNIKFLERFGGSDAPSITFKIDDLTYSYRNENSNQLMKVTENPAGNDNQGFKDNNKTGDDFDYDDNGNMILDKNKNITLITYNHLNLPKKITFGTGNSIEYIYNAAGQKLGKIINEGTLAVKADYLGGYQYKDNVLEFFPTAEGYVKNTNGALSYVFQYKDHLGNIRLSYTKNAQNGLEIIDETHYYPFGLKHEGYVALQESTNKYKYNGKELQDELGLNMYAMDARMYDPAIARWNVIDPVTHHDASTYGAFNNNPVYWVDPSGRDGEHYDYGSGNYVNGNGDVITQEEALAAYGLDGNGKEKDKKKKASSTKSDTGRRRALRQRDDNRGRLTSGSVLFDARGQELLSHWLNGSGKNLELSNKEWGDYMKANGLLPEQIEEAAMNYLYGFREYIKKEGKIDVDFTFHAEIENGYFTGYEMLHGSNKKVGDTQMKGTVEYNSKTSQFDFNVQIIWNDKIDPNKNYGDDIMMSNLLNVFYSPKDYNVKIKWNDKFSYK